MNARVKRLWINALLSGKYKQGVEALRTGKYFCCLGVLCDLHRATHSDKLNNWQKQSYLECTDVLPSAVQKWAGLSADDPQLGRYRAATLNDSGKSFEYIADKIEKYL